MEEKVCFVDKKYVHKTKEENVHIYNVRRQLPVEVSADLFETGVLGVVNPSDEEIVMEHFVKGRGEKEGFYVIPTIPEKIRKFRAEKYLENAEVSDAEKKLLLEYYKLSGDFYTLQKELTEAEKDQIIKIVDRRELHVSDNDKMELSEILEQIDDVPKTDVFYCSMYIDQKHPYFFEHPQEHIPGIMTIEAGRQFIIAICHIFGKVPLTDVSFMLMEMNCSFLNYVELHYPVRLQATMKEVKSSKQGYWSMVDATVTFYQKNKPCASISYIADIIPMALFKRLRADKEKYHQLPRFRPLAGIRDNVSVRLDGKRYICSLVDVSLEGFLLYFKDDKFIQLVGLEKVFEFFMFFPTVGFVTGKAVVRWSEQSSGDSFIVGCHIEEMESIDKENLKEGIKFHCKVKEEREIL
jgi:hypothetical protein